MTQSTVRTTTTGRPHREADPRLGCLLGVREPRTRYNSRSCVRPSMSDSNDTSKTQELADVKHSLSELVADAPALEAFTGFVEGAEAADAIDHETKELVSLAIAVVTRCDHCILWHTDAALDAGATHDEIVDVLNVAVVMGGGPALMYAVDAYETLLALEAERGEH